jgi:hypothetical protein
MQVYMALKHTAWVNLLQGCPGSFFPGSFQGSFPGSLLGSFAGSLLGSFSLLIC